MIILACGPTATVVVPELCREGYQALDLGHIDIQYEYYIRNLTEKCAVSGKYVNESKRKFNEVTIVNKYFYLIMKHIL